MMYLAKQQRDIYSHMDSVRRGGGKGSIRRAGITLDLRGVFTLE